MTDDPRPATPATENTSGGDGGDAAAKDRFREALERKQGRRHPHETASSADGKVHDSRGAAGGKRQHRRKSG